VTRFFFLIVLVSAVQVVNAQLVEPLTDKQKDINQYHLQRQALMVKDHEAAFDRDIVLNQDEMALNMALDQLQDSMLAVYKEQHFFPPARYFFQSKAHIEQTQLFRLLKMMPKGGILHLHGAAAGSAQWVVDRVISEPHAHVYWDEPSETYTKGQIAFYRDGLAPQGFRKAADLNLQEDNFSRSLFSLLTFDEGIDADSVDIWKEFELVFQRLFGFVRYQPVFEDFFYHAFELLETDGIQHVEIRGLLTELYDLEHAAGYYNSDSIVNYLTKAADRIRQTQPNFTMKLIYTSLRFKSREAIEQDLIAAYQLRGKYPEVVAGFDLVAEEDQGHSTLYFLDTWMKMDSLETQYGIDMPLYLHDGESNWVSVDNLYDAVLLDSRRIGHGFNLFRFPHLLEEVKRRDICLELNPISNQVLGYIRDLRLNPGSTYLTRGVACTISSDDPLIYDYQGLSYDFWEIFLAWELDLRALKGLALNSLKYSALEGEEKKQAMKHFNSEWNEFVEAASIQLKIKN